MKKTIIALCALSALTISCAKSDDSKSSSSNACSQTVIDARNSLSSDAQTYVANPTTSNLRAMDAACRHFKAVIGDSKCIAMNNTTGAEMELSYSAVAEHCSQISDAANQ